MSAWPERTTQEVLDYGFDWSELLQPAEMIETNSATATAGLIVERSFMAGTKQVVWLSGGLRGATGKVSLTITTNQERKFNRVVEIPIS